ncbi:MAG: hypothetical protein ACRDU8_03055 [Egibacteraceae bacterium]
MTRCAATWCGCGATPSTRWPRRAAALAAVGTLPPGDWQVAAITPKRRYQQIADKHEPTGWRMASPWS